MRLVFELVSREAGLGSGAGFSFGNWAGLGWAERLGWAGFPDFLSVLVTGWSFVIET